MLTVASTTPRLRNQLLNALPESEFQRLRPDLTPVRMSLGETLYEVGEPIDYIYFPENAIVSTVSFFEDGASLETGIIGREGMTGIPVALTTERAPRETAVQAAGTGWKMPAEKFRAEFFRGGTLQHIVLRYIYAFLEQVAQSGACINHHPVNKRLARWLLMCHDRTDGDDLHITHDFISQMLGVNRPSVTGAAIELKDEGMIKYSRGVVTILDRARLEGFTCECYESIRRVYDHFLSLLELRHLNRRWEQANRQVSGEIQRRREVENITHKNIQNLENAFAGFRNLSVRIRICKKCQRMCDSRNNRKLLDGYFGKRLNARFLQVICSDCANN